jgi:hypothetical protein
VEVSCLAAEMAWVVLEAHEERYMTRQRSSVSMDSCSAKEKSCMKRIGNRLESSRLPKRARASQEATARIEGVVVKMHCLLPDRYEQRDPEGRRRSVRLEQCLYGIVLQGR